MKKLANSLKYNSSLNSHAEFLAWIFDTRAEHNLQEMALYLFMRTLSTKQQFYRYEVQSIAIAHNKKRLVLSYKLTDKCYTLQLKITPKGLYVTTKHMSKKISWSKLFDTLLLPFYEYISGYQGKKIVRVFINESKLITHSIYQESHKAYLGKKRFSKELQRPATITEAMQILQKSGELLSYKKIAKLQKNKSTLIYGSVFNKHSFDIFGYKLVTVKKHKPEIMSIGSSRTHFFRSSFFTRPFYNASYAMTYLQEGIRFIEALPKSATPKLLLLCVEFWWFHPNHYKEVPFLPLHTTHHHFDVDYINKLYEYYYDGILSAEDIEYILESQQHSSQVENFKAVGLRASKSAEGYLQDGYYWYATSLQTPNVVRSNKPCIEMMQKNFFHFEQSRRVSAEKVELFEHFLNSCSKKGITPILILPPFMKKTTHTLLHSKKYRYIHDVIAYLKSKTEYEFYNFLSPKSIQSPKSEFYDCYHGGDVTYARMLRAILQNRDSLLHDFCSIDALDAIIQENKQRITLKENTRG